jgi:hypothetical protein
MLSAPIGHRKSASATPAALDARNIFIDGELALHRSESIDSASARKQGNKPIYNQAARSQQRI